jgi:hypothetical protein
MFFQQGKHLPGFRVPPQPEFGEDERPGSGDFKCTTRTLHQLDFGVRVFLSDLSRQTGGPRLVVSSHAVLNSDLHHGSRLVQAAS